jgi:hypothetical protein
VPLPDSLKRLPVGRWDSLPIPSDAQASPASPARWHGPLPEGLPLRRLNRPAAACMLPISANLNYVANMSMILLHYAISSTGLIHRCSSLWPLERGSSERVVLDRRRGDVNQRPMPVAVSRQLPQVDHVSRIHLKVHVHRGIRVRLDAQDC